MSQLSFLTSSAVDSFAYNVATRQLTLQFHDGSIYLYEDVPPVLTSELALAHSVGTFFNLRIKNVFAFRKVDAIVLD